MSITITKYKDHKDSALGAWKYWHLIQFEEDGYKYDLNATDECIMKLSNALMAGGNIVNYNVK